MLIYIYYSTIKRLIQLQCLNDNDILTEDVQKKETGMKNILKLLRVKHYIKNSLIFVPFVFSTSLNTSKLLFCFVGFWAFSLISSCIYIINDIKDIENDRLHPKKKNRPIASGIVSVKTGIKIALFCFIISIGAILTIILRCGIKYSSLIWLLTYFLLNLLYTSGFKNIPILDIIILMSGFLIRILFGAVLADTFVSSWLYLTVMSGAFYLALGKRRNEILKTEIVGETRKVLEAYNRNFLDKFMYVCLAMANIFYALWAKEYPKRYMILTVPLVVIISMQYSLDVEGDSDGDPIEVVLSDKKLLILLVLLILIISIILFVL